jgi:hypothetical protein
VVDDKLLNLKTDSAKLYDISGGNRELIHSTMVVFVADNPPNSISMIFESVILKRLGMKEPVSAKLEGKGRKLLLILIHRHHNAIVYVGQETLDFKVLSLENVYELRIRLEETQLKLTTTSELELVSNQASTIVVKETMRIPVPYLSFNVNPTRHVSKLNFNKLTNELSHRLGLQALLNLGSSV